MNYLLQKKDSEDVLPLPSVEEIGEKATGLLKISCEWTPPFFILTTGFFFVFEKHRPQTILQIDELRETLEVLNKKLNELKVLGFAKVIVRSSAVIETLSDRGTFESLHCNNDLNSVLSTTEKILIQTSEFFGDKVNNQLALIIQGFVSPRYSGHLSNERRISNGLDFWSVEYINHSSNVCQSKTFKISDDQLPLEAKKIICTRKDVVINKLKKLAFNSYSQAERCHFEWIWDGTNLWIVQKDSEVIIPGTKPGNNWNYKDVEIDHTKLTVLRVDKDCTEDWSKITNIKTFRNCTLPSVVFFVLEDLVIKEKLLKGEECDALDEDLKTLSVYPFVIRTSLKQSDTIHQALYLPRTDTIFDWQLAKTFLIENTKKMVRDENLTLSDFSFLIHHFIVSKSCALVYAIPERSKVRIDSSWGLADGLAYNSYDSFEVDLGTKTFKKKIRGKNEYLDVDEKGKWIIKKSGSNWDWKSSLDKGEVLSIAEMSHGISTFLNKPLIIMFFVNHPNSRIHSHILPWQLIQQIPKFSETISEKMFDRKKIIISNQRDFDRFKRRYDVQFYENEKVTIHLKLDPHILRDTHFIKDIGSLAKEGDFHLEIEGSTLSHIYYILSNQGVKVRCFDLFEPKYGKQDFNKLVRDKIPAKIFSHGESSIVSKIPENLLIELLKAKVVEEALELQNSSDQNNLLEELADIIELVTSISNATKISFSDIERLAQKKREERGGFEDGIYLRQTKEISITNYTSPKKTASHKLSIKSFSGQKVKIDESKIIVSLIPSIIRNESTVLFIKTLNKYAHVKYTEKEVTIILDDNISPTNTNQLKLFEID